MFYAVYGSLMEEGKNEFMKQRQFSLKVFLLIIIALSWPFQIGYGFLGENFRPILLVSMIMTGVATSICGKYVFKDGCKKAGWSWGKPKYYVFAFALPLFLWFVPTVLEQWMGMHKTQQLSESMLFSTFLTAFLITLIPAFAEEFSWRGYLLPRLMMRHTVRKALLIHGFVTWFWHLPVVIIMGMQMGGNLPVTVLAVMFISLVPTIMHAIIFAYFWSASKSLAVSTVYHSAFDETRDTLQGSIGFGPLVEIWQMATIIVLGLTLLWRAKLTKI